MATNPTITPYTNASAPYTVGDSDVAYFDLQLSDISSGASFSISASSVAFVEIWTLHAGELALRLMPDPADILGVPTVGGSFSTTWNSWDVQVAPGTPTLVSITRTGGGANDAPLRVRVSNVRGGGAADTTTLTAQSNAQTLRIMGGPSIVGATPSGSEAVEGKVFTLVASASVALQQAAGLPPALGAAPTALGVWERLPSPLAFSLTAAPPSNATFPAPSVYEDTDVGFRFRAFYDINADGTFSPATDPKNETELTVSIRRVRHRMLLVLDRSGSMSSSLPEATVPMSKWDASVRAAHAWLDLFFALRDGDGQQAGVLTFEHDGCGWGGPASGGNITLRNPANGATASGLSSLASFANLSALNLGAPGSCTPIGDALVSGMQALNSPPPSFTNDHCTIVLLTDGYENSGFTTIKESLPTGATKRFSQERANVPAVNDNLSLYAFAVGTGVDEDTLNNLPSLVGTGQLPGNYRLTRDTAEILPSLAEMLGHALDAQRLITTMVGNAAEFTLNSGERKLVILVPWSNGTDSLRITYLGSVLPTGPGSGVTIHKRATHGMAVIDVATALAGLPPSGNCRVERLPSGSSTPGAIQGVLVMVDLFVKAELTFDRTHYRSGEPMVVTCRLRAGHAAIKDASVTVSLDAPGQGVGSFLVDSAVALGVGTASPASASNASGGTLVSSVGGIRAADPTGGKQRGLDPGSLKAQALQAFLDRQKLAVLPLASPPPLFRDGTHQLFDDGAHEDGVAGNGDYANVLTRTFKEGTYTFRVNVTGTLANGEKFTRTLSASKWVGVLADAVASPVTVTPVTSTVTGQLWVDVSVQPRDARGEYLGPFREGEVAFSASSGSFEPLQATLDGTYRRRLVYAAGDVPVIQVHVNGTPLTPKLPFDPKDCLGFDEASRHFAACKVHLGGFWRGCACLPALVCAAWRFQRSLGQALCHSSKGCPVCASRKASDSSKGQDREKGGDAAPRCPHCG